MGWLIALAILILLAILPLGVSAKYDESGPLVRVIAGPIRIRVFPLKKKPGPKKPDKEKKKEKKEKPVSKTEKKPEKKGGKVTDFLPLVRVGLDFLRAFTRKLRVNLLEMKITLAGGDPCDLAVNYGKAWAALGNLVPQLEKIFVIKKRDMQVQCDFVESETRIYARLDLTITLGRLLALGTVYGFRGLREFIKIKNIRKGGAVK